MKFLTSPLAVALLAALLNVGTTAGLILAQKDRFSVLAQNELPMSRLALTQKMWGFNSDEIQELSAELKAERAKLETRETDLNKLAAQLQAERAELDKVRGDIKTMREEMSNAIPEVQVAEVKNLKSLAQTYSSLTPPAAVAILRELDEQMGVKILSMMKSDKVGAILQEMTREQDKDDNMAKRAARISDKLRLLKPLKKENPSA